METAVVPVTIGVLVSILNNLNNHHEKTAAIQQYAPTSQKFLRFM